MNTPMDNSDHQMSIAEFKQHFIRKRLDVMSDFTKGVHNGFDKDDMPIDPTEEQMQKFADSKWLIRIEAWHMFRGERAIGRFKLQDINQSSVKYGLTILVPCRWRQRAPFFRYVYG